MHIQNRRMHRLGLFIAALLLCFVPFAIEAKPVSLDAAQSPLSSAHDGTRSETAQPHSTQTAATLQATHRNDAKIGVDHTDIDDIDTDEAPSTDKPVAGQTSPACGFMKCLALLPLDDVTEYTVASDGASVRSLASHWGIRPKNLLSLNPNLDENSILNKGDKVVVNSRSSSTPAPISRGRANKGRMYHSRPMPEGAGFFLRDHRPNSWGNDTTIRALVTVFANYAQAFPTAPAINVGDLSKQNGGKLKPHKSHQSGRDVDFGFAHTAATAQSAKQHFTRASRSNLDVEKTWFLVEQLARTGSVQVIYVDNAVQKLLYQYAAPKLTPEQREYFFSIPRHSNSSSALLRHWPGHKNHFHVRFKCPDGQYNCK